VFFDLVKDTMQTASEIRLGDWEQVSEKSPKTFINLKNTAEL
jgi:hypothetical protein